jgi:hypothetical protein
MRTTVNLMVWIFGLAILLGTRRHLRALSDLCRRKDVLHLQLLREGRWR